MIMKNKYIPIHYNNNYYLYDCLNKYLFTVDEKVYHEFKNCDNNRLLERINKSTSLYPKSDKNNNIFHVLSTINTINNKKLYIYPEFQRKNVIESIIRTQHITLEITELCNLNCIYCCYGKLYLKTQHNQIGDKNRITDFLKKILYLKANNQIITDLRISFYGGEPLIQFDTIKECVEIACSILPNVNIKFAMTTNAVLLDKHIDYLIMHDFDICISLDGNKANNQYRIFKNGKQSFETVKKNIDFIQKKHPIFFEKNISFSTVLHNKSNCIDACHFFSQYKKEPIFSYLSISGTKKRSKKFSEINTQHQYNEKELENFKLDYPELYKSLFSNPNDTIYSWGRNRVPKNLNELFKEEQYIYPGGSCFLFQNRIFITVNGDILLCEKSSRKFKFGKITNKGFTIYLKRINKYYHDIIEIYRNQCTDCYKCFSCPKCYFSSHDEINKGLCICTKEQAIKEMNDIVYSKL